jgi:hypothetical protein
LEKKFDFGKQNWAAGDLVQINRSGPREPIGEPEGLGILLSPGPGPVRQGDLFPAFYVYSLKLQTAKKYYSTELKLISPANP